MGLGINPENFKVPLEGEELQLYNARKQALEELTDKSKVFFQDSSIDEIVVQSTPFARPTWITSETDMGYIKRNAQGWANKHVIIGQGGSIEPVMSIYEAIIDPYRSKSSSNFKVIAIDGPNPDDHGFRYMATPSLPIDKTCVYVITKSGFTLNAILAGLKFHEHGYKLVFIREDKDNTTRKIAERLIKRQGKTDDPSKKIEYIEHTPVGGRFTANQPNTLIPIYSVAISAACTEEIEAFVKAINKMGQKYRPDVPIKNNLAKEVALLLYKAELAGYKGIYMPYYSKKLRRLANHTLQLIHETYGKNNQGQIVETSEGPECHHFSSQNFFGGPPRVGITVGVYETENDLTANVSGFEDIPLKSGEKLGQLDGLSFKDLLHDDRMGLVKDGVEQSIPIMDWILDRVDGDSIGTYTGFLQWIVIYSAFLRSSRWEDQPNVEGSKNKTLEMALSRVQIDNYLKKFIEV